MRSDDKAAALGLAALAVVGLPPLIFESFELAVYGFGCAGAGIFAALALCVMDESRKAVPKPGNVVKLRE